jgi:hypothetical protein
MEKLAVQPSSGQNDIKFHVENGNDLSRKIKRGPATSAASLRRGAHGPDAHRRYQAVQDTGYTVDSENILVRSYTTITRSPES